MGTRTAYFLGAPPVWHGMARTDKVIGGVVAIQTADLTIGGIVKLFRVPANFLLTGASIDFPQLDTGAGLTLSLGPTEAPNLLLNASTAGRANTATVPIAFGARGYRFAAETDLLLTAVAAAATAQAGNVVVFLHGCIEP